jgi:dynactin complex subunit
MRRIVSETWLYIGTAKFAKGTVIGLEVEKWEPNGYNVTVKGRTYFSTPPGRGYFLQH